MNKYKPCPFCGSQPYTKVYIKGPSYHTDMYKIEVNVVCTKCGIMQWVDTLSARSIEEFAESVEKLSKAAADLWNTRQEAKEEQ